jgi:1-acyl-sn-glycerol-3-phosphate acyltransferase
LNALNYAWRLMFTGVGFLLFTGGSFVCSFLIFPALHVLPGGKVLRQRRAKLLVRALFAMLVGLLRVTGVMRLNVAGVERLRDASAVLVLANHPSYIDVAVLLSLIPRATCVVKGGSPVFGGVVSATGYISNDDPEQVVEDCGRALAAGDAVIIFPEGTRTRPNEPLKFLRGAAHVALKTGSGIVPVLLQCFPPTLTKGEPWYRIPPEAFNFRVIVRNQLDSASLADVRLPPVIAARRLTRALEGWFSEELKTL